MLLSTAPCWRRPLRHTWTDNSPRGFWRGQEWRPLSCSLPNVTPYFVKRCLHNTTVLLLGDSNTRKVRIFFFSLSLFMDRYLTFWSIWVTHGSMQSVVFVRPAVLHCLNLNVGRYTQAFQVTHTSHAYWHRWLLTFYATDNDFDLRWLSQGEHEAKTNKQKILVWFSRALFNSPCCETGRHGCHKKWNKLNRWRYCRESSANTLWWISSESLWIRL